MGYFSENYDNVIVTKNTYVWHFHWLISISDLLEKKKAWNCISLNAYNFCYECARDLMSFPVVQKYESIIGKAEILNRSRIMAVVA